MKFFMGNKFGEDAIGRCKVQRPKARDRSVFMHTHTIRALALLLWYIFLSNNLGLRISYDLRGWNGQTKVLNNTDYSSRTQMLVAVLTTEVNSNPI